MLYSFEDYVLDTDQRELRRGTSVVPLQPQVFDLLEYLIANRERVVTKDDLIAAVWAGRIVSESALTTRINAARTAIGDSGEAQRLIKTLPRKGIRFVGAVREGNKVGEAPASASPAIDHAPIQKGAVAPAAERPPHAERRPLTVVSCELLLGRTTSGTRRIDPEDLREAIETYQQCIRGAVTPFEGSIGNSVGKTVVIYFGFPAAHEDDAERAVRAALALIQAVQQLGRGWQARIGISTGQVVVGDLDGESPRDAPVGEAPMTASQLQNAARADAVLIDFATRQLVGNLFDCREIEPIKTSGMLDPLAAWRVTGASFIESRFEALRQIALTPLVGREEELELLLRRWTQAKCGEGRAVLVCGEPGIGKSRLVAELEKSLRSESHVRLRYFCSPNFRDSALRPVTVQIERAAGLESDDDSKSRLEKLVQLLAQTSTSDEDIGLFAELMSLPASDRYPLSNDPPQVRREKTFDALLRQLEHVARDKPILMLFEDIHWIDPTSHELLDRTIELAAQLPLLLLVTFRPEFHAPWTGQSHVTALTLSRLNRRHGLALINGVAGDDSLRGELVEEIAARTDGVPLFVEELTKAVLEAETAEQRGEALISRIPPRTLAIPATLHASLMARLDRLGPAAKEIAQIGAAIGREFSYDLLAAVAQHDEQALRMAVEQLAEAGLVLRRGTPPQATFTFKHALVQESAYETLLRRPRQQLHARICDALEARIPDVVERQPELLAYHLSEAALSERAAAYWLRAIQVASARSANIEAVAHATRGLDELQSLPASVERDRRELALRSALGPALIATRGYAADDTVMNYERARDLIQATEDHSNWDVVLLGLSVAYYNHGNYRRALELGWEFMRQAERSHDPIALCVGHRIIAGQSNPLGEFLASETHGEAAFSFYDPARHPQIAWRYAHDIGVAAASQWAIGAWHRGHIGVANKAREQALTIAKRLDHHNTTGYALYYNGVLPMFLQRDFTGLAAFAAELLAHAEKYNLPQWTAWTCGLEGVARGHAGRSEDGIAAIQHGISLCEKIRNYSMRTVFLAGLAETYLTAGYLDQAGGALEAAFSVAEQTEERWMNAELWRLHAELALARGGRAAASEAERCFERGIAVAEQQGSMTYKLRLTTGLSKLIAQRGQAESARRMLDAALQPFSDGFETPDLKISTEALKRLEEHSR